MSEEISMKGSTLYRIAFIVFIIGCLFNAFDSYVSHTVYYWLPQNQTERQWDTWLYLILAFILAVECVGLLMFKRMKLQLKKMES